MQNGRSPDITYPLNSGRLGGQMFEALPPSKSCPCALLNTRTRSCGFRVAFLWRKPRGRGCLVSDAGGDPRRGHGLRLDEHHHSIGTNPVINPTRFGPWDERLWPFGRGPTRKPRAGFWSVRLPVVVVRAQKQNSSRHSWLLLAKMRRTIRVPERRPRILTAAAARWYGWRDSNPRHPVPETPGRFSISNRT